MPTPNVTKARHSRRKPPVAVLSSAASTSASEFRIETAVPSAPGDRPDAERRRQMIAEAAYYLAEKRGFATGGEIDDWLEAEARLEALLRE